MANDPPALPHRHAGAGRHPRLSLFVAAQIARKNKETTLRAVLKPPGTKRNKVFLLLFFQKKKLFLLFHFLNECPFSGMPGK
jgi:hypothetical protein